VAQNRINKLRELARGGTIMVKVFIGGSQSIRKLPSSVAARIDNVIDRGFTVLIGDAIGADTCVQKCLAEKVYAYVLVFCTDACRNNAGGWAPLLAKCGERALAIFEEKLGLSKRLGHSRRTQTASEELKRL
jgi:hypothetical protein